MTFGLLVVLFYYIRAPAWAFLRTSLLPSPRCPDLPALDRDAVRLGLLGRPGWTGMWPPSHCTWDSEEHWLPCSADRGFSPSQGVPAEPQRFGNGALGLRAPSPGSTKVLAPPPHPTHSSRGPKWALLWQ